MVDVLLKTAWNYSEAMAASACRIVSIRHSFVCVCVCACVGVVLYTLSLDIPTDDDHIVLDQAKK